MEITSGFPDERHLRKKGSIIKRYRRLNRAYLRLKDKRKETSRKMAELIKDYEKSLRRGDSERKKQILKNLSSLRDEYISVEGKMEKIRRRIKILETFDPFPELV